MSMIKSFDLLKLHDISIGIHVIGKVFNKLRNLCSIALKNSKIKLGGVAETLLIVIYDYIEEETTIISDSWSSYSKLKDFKNVNHLTVNHSINFVDPGTSAHTNKIEGLWKQAKDSFKQMNGCSRVHLKSYIDEFIRRSLFCVGRVDAFQKILETMSIYSPVDGVLLDEEAKISEFDEYEIDLDEQDGTWDEPIKEIEETPVDLSKTILNEDNNLVICIDVSEQIILEKLSDLQNHFQNCTESVSFANLSKSQRALIHGKCEEYEPYAQISHSDEANEVVAQVLQPEVTRTLTYACD
ncbi:unnamed protein product [Brachionus calyciflorus]|uniref:ISXO2-like transposase domain-containing protein n=1 Tax=Brachionus calyciflorus TaxID=104777 RepID=A0A814MIC5_9BILA|nr:unnamed protein product [Brachionus calyciflorus]